MIPKAWTQWTEINLIIPYLSVYHSQSLFNHGTFISVAEAGIIRVNQINTMVDDALAPCDIGGI